MMNKKISLECAFCNKPFSNDDNLSMHIISIHKSIIEGNKSLVSEKSSYKNVESCHQTDKIYTCVKCDNQFTSTNILKHHVKCDRENICNICSKIFCQKSSLKRHLLDHEDQNNFICDVCGKEFNYKRNLNTHISVQHADKHALAYRDRGKDIICGKCNKIFTRMYHLRRHLLTHGGKKEFKCDICPKEFSQKSHLKNHVS